MFAKIFSFCSLASQSPQQTLKTNHTQWKNFRDLLTGLTRKLPSLKKQHTSHRGIFCQNVLLHAKEIEISA